MIGEFYIICPVVNFPWAYKVIHVERDTLWYLKQYTKYSLKAKQLPPVTIMLDL